MKQYVKPETTSFQTTPNCTLCASTNVGVELGKMKVKSFGSSTPILVLALMLSGLLTLPSCKNGNGDIDQPAAAFKKGEVVSITTAPIGSGNKGPRKVHIGSETSGEAQLVWDANDQLRVIVQEDDKFASADFNLTAGAGDKTGTFTGTMPANGTEFFLAYPCGNVTVSAWNELSQTVNFQQVKVPNVQDFTYGATSFNSGIMPVVGYGRADTDGNLTGSTTIVGGALRVKLTNSTNKDITFNKIKLYVLNPTLSSSSETNTSVWSSGYTVDYNVDSKEVTPSGTSASNKNIVLNLSQEVTLTAGATSDYFYFVMVAPLYFKKDANELSFTVYLYNQEGNVTKTDELTTIPVATTSFNYNIFIEPGDIVEGTLIMTATKQL